MKLKLAAVFGSDMVLQRDMAAPVWGTAPAGEIVTVSISGRTAQAAASPDGSWRVNLPAGPAGGPFSP